MQKIIPSLWVDKDAEGIANFYASVFPGSEIKSKATITDTPSGTVDIISIDILGFNFTIMAAGPLFKFTPAISFTVCTNSKEEVDAYWEKLVDGGVALMELASYPFSERYGWVKDKYGLTWQLIYVGDQEITQRIIPSLMFTGDMAGKTEEAVTFYTSVFKDSAVGDVMRYGAGREPDREGTVEYARFTLAGEQFSAMDSAHPHGFTFNEAISFEVRCEDQAEIDYYWGLMSAHPESEQCGWLKDKYGVSWQIVPKGMDRMLREGDPEKIARVTQAFLEMKKFDIAALERAAAGEE